MNEHPFYNELSLVLVNTYAPKNKFQELVCKMLSPLHGMLVETERIDTVFDDIEAIVLQADIERPRRTTAMQFETTTEASDRYGKLCRAAVISDVIKGTRVGNEVATVYFHPVHGVLQYLNEGGTQRMQPVMFGKVSAEWLAQYVDMVEKGGAA